MPLSLHEFAGFQSVDWDSNSKKRTIAQAINSHEVEQTFSTLIISGVLERFPALKVVSAELNCGWLPFFLHRIDERFDHRGIRFRGTPFATKLTLKPSDYFRRQLYATFIDDTFGIAHAARNRRGQHSLVLRLSPQRDFLAQIAGKNRRRFSKRQRGRPGQNSLQEYRGALRF